MDPPMASRAPLLFPEITEWIYGVSGVGVLFPVLSMVWTKNLLTVRYTPCFIHPLFSTYFNSQSFLAPLHTYFLIRLTCLINLIRLCRWDQKFWQCALKVFLCVYKCTWVSFFFFFSPSPSPSSSLKTPTALLQTPASWDPIVEGKVGVN